MYQKCHFPLKCFLVCHYHLQLSVWCSKVLQYSHLYVWTTCTKYYLPHIYNSQIYAFLWPTHTFNPAFVSYSVFIQCSLTCCLWMYSIIKGLKRLAASPVCKQFFFRRATDLQLLNDQIRLPSLDLVTGGVSGIRNVRDMTRRSVPAVVCSSLILSSSLIFSVRRKWKISRKLWRFVIWLSLLTYCIIYASQNMDVIKQQIKIKYRNVVQCVYI